MDLERVEWFYSNEKYFTDEALPIIYKCLEICTPEQFDKMKSVRLRNPSVATALAITCGFLGIDRFYLGNIVIGIIKIVTLGGGIFALTLLDIFTDAKRARVINSKKVIEIVDKVAADNAVRKTKFDIARTTLKVNDKMGEFFDEVDRRERRY